MPISPNVIMDRQNFEYIQALIDEGHMMQDINAKGYFSNQFLYPKKDNYGIMRTCEHCQSKYKDKESQERYRKELENYRVEDIRLHDLFKISLLYAYDLHPLNEKAQKLFDIAWDKGHANGHSEVILEFDELIELIK